MTPPLNGILPNPKMTSTLLTVDASRLPNMIAPKSDGKEWQKTARENPDVRSDRVAAGDHRLKPPSHRACNEKVFALEHTITIADLLTVDTSGQWPLNNLVTEVLPVICCRRSRRAVFV